jgi:hypothetical protein
MKWTEILTALVAVYGAVLATINLISRLRDNKARVRVKISTGFLEYGYGPLSEFMVFLEAANNGLKAVTLNSPFIRLPDGKQLIIRTIQSNVSFPYELVPGKSCRTWLEVNQLYRTLKSNHYRGKIKICAVYRDQLDTCYISKPIKLNTETLDNSSKA